MPQPKLNEDHKEKKVFAKNRSVFSSKSGEDQKKNWDYIRPEFVGFIRAGWLFFV